MSKDFEKIIEEAKGLKKNYSKRGPKKIEIDWEDFDKLCAMQCTLQEIASWFDCSIDTIENRVMETHGIKFSDYYKKKSAPGKISLRRKQFEVALKGNVSMLIFLGKQYLGQSDKQDVLLGDIANKTTDELKKELCDILGLKFEN